MTFERTSRVLELYTVMEVQPEAIVEYYSSQDNEKYHMYHKMMQDFLKKKDVIAAMVNKHLYEKDPNAVRGIMGVSSNDPEYIMNTPRKEEQRRIKHARFEQIMSRTKSLKEMTKERAASIKKHQLQMELNKYKSTREDEKQQKMEILVNKNEERQQRQQEALKDDLNTQEELFQAKLAARRKNCSLNRLNQTLGSTRLSKISSRESFLMFGNKEKQRSRSRAVLNSFYHTTSGTKDLKLLDQSFGGISTVGNDFDDTRSDSQHMGGEVRGEIKRIYDSTQKEIEKLYKEREQRIDQVQERFTNMLFEQMQGVLPAFEASIQNIEEQIEKMKGSADIKILAKTRDTLVSERERNKAMIEKRIDIQKKVQIQKIKKEFKEKLDQLNRQTVKKRKKSFRNLSSSRQMLGGYYSGVSSLASLHSQLDKKNHLPRELQIESPEKLKRRVSKLEIQPLSAKGYNSVRLNL